MKQLVVIVVVALMVAGFAVVIRGCGPHAKARAACENVVEQCGGALGESGVTLINGDLDACADQLIEESATRPDQDEAIECMAEATSCTKVLGCMIRKSVGEPEGQADRDRLKR
jgi:hypothetical protein